MKFVIMDIDMTTIDSFDTTTDYYTVPTIDGGVKELWDLQAEDPKKFVYLRLNDAIEYIVRYKRKFSYSTSERKHDLQKALFNLKKVNRTIGLYNRIHSINIFGRRITYKKLQVPTIKYLQKIDYVTDGYINSAARELLLMIADRKLEDAIDYLELIIDRY